MSPNKFICYHCKSQYKHYDQYSHHGRALVSLRSIAVKAYLKTINDLVNGNRFVSVYEKDVYSIAGCPEPMKTIFLRDLMSFFTSKMTSSTNGTGPGEMVKWGASKEEQAATWTYVMLDNDKNKALERREWKSFHQLISSVDSLRRCGRKLPRYCDVNHDAKISITEWMACLDVTQASQAQTTETVRAPANPRRKGPNPLESILKADD